MEVLAWTNVQTNHQRGSSVDVSKIIPRVALEFNEFL
jgi:hypothetical protein